MKRNERVPGEAGRMRAYISQKTLDRGHFVVGDGRRKGGMGVRNGCSLATRKGGVM